MSLELCLYWITMLQRPALFLPFCFVQPTLYAQRYAFDPFNARRRSRFQRPVILPLSLTLLAGLILWAHRNNIMDLIRREKISIPIKKLKEKIK